MKKVILCSCVVAALLCCLIVPSFAANWFGSSSQVVDCYSYTVSVASNSNPTFYLPFGSSNACTAARDFTVGSYSITSGDTFYADSVNGYSDLFVNGSDVGRISGTAINTVLYIEESSFTAFNSTVRECTPIYVTVGQSGFVSDGFSSGLGIAGTVVNFCISNTYVLIAIGLAVAVPLVGWGISKLKSLIKGY